MKNRTGLIGADARGDVSSYKGTLSGTLIKQAQVTSTWLLYPNACNDRKNGVPPGPGTWAPKTSIVADSLNGYDPVTQNHGYGVLDNSLKERLWHITDGSDSPDIGAGLVVAGSRSLWCGKYDVNWVVRSGYPNLTFQILYVDTDLNALNASSTSTLRGSPYTLTWQENVSTEYNYDYLYLIGGGDGGVDRDPIGNSRSRLDKIVADGFDGNAEMLLIQTGSLSGTHTLSYVAHGQQVKGPGLAGNSTWSLSGIPAQHRGLIFLFTADCLYSSEDGLWPDGHGQRLDRLTATDQPGGLGNLYDEQTAAGGTDPFDGDILVSVNGQYSVSARVAPGVGPIWTIQAGNNLPTADFCQPKSASTDKMFLGADPTSKLTIPNSYASVVTCALPIPGGTGSVLQLFDAYTDLPSGSGMILNVNYKVFTHPPGGAVTDGSWGNWTDASAGVTAGLRQAWWQGGDEIAAATQADSVQLRYDIQCIPSFAVDRVNCQPAQYGIMYDNLYLRVLTGVPAPVFDVFPGNIAQTTFVDGTDPLSTGCNPATIAAARCWPGKRGSDQPADSNPIHNNFNSPYDDPLTLNLLTGIRKFGMGINWEYGFDVAVDAGRIISRHNTSGRNASFDTPRWIFRIFDPATKTWSPWDSSALDANSASISGNDTILIDSGFRFDWPPRDKYYVNSGGADVGPNADASFAGGFTLNGATKFSQVPFLPRGTRIQYYFKAVDILGGVSYDFGTDRFANEIEDLPNSPGIPPTNPAAGPRVPDLIEFDVLPGVYAAGDGGTVGAGQTTAMVLNLDSRYSSWPDGYDPITTALHQMGVRADRYRHTQGAGNASGIGGHELPGRRVTRLSNYFPNVEEYGIKDLLANQYRIMIDLHAGYNEEDAGLLQQWWSTDTGVDGGDRGYLVAGDNVFNALLNDSKQFPQYQNQVSLANNVFGVATAVDAWSGTNTRSLPAIDDLFVGGTGAGLATAGNHFTYTVDGGCPGPNRFDGLTRVGSSEAFATAFYPGGATDLAGIARMSDLDSPATDNDRSKSLGYAYSLNYVEGARERILFRFLTGVRQTSVSTTPCWPCPADPADMGTNWSGKAGFNTATYGGLYPIQTVDPATVTGVGTAEAPKVNRLEGNFPNPFNPETAIRFSAAAPGKVTIRIFDVAGRLVNTLAKNVTEAGLNEIRWNGKSTDGRTMASGLYFYRIRFANGQESEAKMAMLK